MSHQTYYYAVRQYQPQENYNGETVYCYEKEETAIECARILNKTYGDNCIFNMEGDFEECLNEDNCHYYTVETFRIDNDETMPDKLQYYEFFVIKVGWFYVGDNDMKVNGINNAKKFNTWDEARSMIKVLESLDVYEGVGPMYIKGINHKY